MTRRRHTIGRATKHYKAIPWHGDPGTTRVVITATDPDAKQVFFGWGSDRDAIDGSFYGNSGADYHHVRDTEYATWEWKLTEAGVHRMISNIERHIDDPNYYAGREKTIAKELLRLLKRFA